MKIRHILIAVVFLTCCVSAWAGPPFITNDPGVLEPSQWEIYLAATRQNSSTGNSDTLPQIEVDYGVTSKLTIQLIVPFASSSSAVAFVPQGLGNLQIAAEYQFWQETKRRPMAAVAPQIGVPVGNSSHDLGSRNVQFFLPVWFEKNWGLWTTYGGGGYVINPGDGNRNYWLTGWALLKDTSKHLTIGGEIYRFTSSEVDTPDNLNFNIGGYYNIDDGHQILLSVGRSIVGNTSFTSYIGYAWTFGPKGKDLPKPENNTVTGG